MFRTAGRSSRGCCWKRSVFKTSEAHQAKIGAAPHGSQSTDLRKQDRHGGQHEQRGDTQGEGRRALALRMWGRADMGRSCWRWTRSRRTSGPLLIAALSQAGICRMGSNGSWKTRKQSCFSIEIKMGRKSESECYVLRKRASTAAKREQLLLLKKSKSSSELFCALTRLVTTAIITRRLVLRGVPSQSCEHAPIC